MMGFAHFITQPRLGGRVVGFVTITPSPFDSRLFYPITDIGCTPLSRYPAIPTCGAPSRHPALSYFAAGAPVIGWGSIGACGLATAFPRSTSNVFGVSGAMASPSITGRVV
ncbi:MAG: hypothetical protein H0W83_18130 [Planctomycetes bacterium]|nr:hypothetical protein [Planctomycetota bacterium]